MRPFLALALGVGLLLSPTPSQDLRAATTTAIQELNKLVVKGRAPKTGYDRDLFGSGWVDVNRNGCDTRNDILIRDLTKRTMDGRCKVLSGTLDDPYSTRIVKFVRGGASEVDIDHVVALSDAWQKGAQSWPFAKRVAFANDPLNLLAADASLNRQKGDSDAASWLPPDRSARCSYVARQIAVKKKYKVWVTTAEKSAMSKILSTCKTQKLPSPGPQPTIASNTGGSEPVATSPTKTPQSSDGTTDPRFDTCTALFAAGYKGNYVRGIDPEYDWYRDADNDGIVCE